MMLLDGRFSEALSRPPATLGLWADDCWVLSTSTKPDYTYGNLVVFEDVPNASRIGGLVRVWERHFAGTECTRPALAFEQAGLNDPDRFDARAREFNLDLNVADVLELAKQPPRWARHPAAEIRPIREDHEWEQLLSASSKEDDFGIYDLPRWLVSERRKIVAAGKGMWWGVFRGQNLVGSCGAFFSYNCVRFEQLRVAVDHRGKGFGSLLFSNLTSLYYPSKIVIEATHSSWLSAFYQRIGYRISGLTFTFVRRPL